MVEKLVYRQWADVPGTLATKTQLAVEGLRLVEGQPVVAYKAGLHGNRYALYERGAAVAKRPVTAAQLAALEAAVCDGCRHSPAMVGRLSGELCGACMRERKAARIMAMLAEDARVWARELLGSNDALILDSETTGLGSSAEIIELGVIDMQGRVVFDRRLRPVGGIDPRAAAVHGITLSLLAGTPTLCDLHADLVALLVRRRVVIYNAAFDQRMLMQSCRAWGLAEISMQTYCVMVQYAAFLERKRWVGLEGGDHSAVGDCRAVLALLQQMAGIG